MNVLAKQPMDRSIETGESMHISQVVIPEPTIMIDVVEIGDRTISVYAWKCEHERLGISVLGNSKEESKSLFLDALFFEVVKLKSEWLDKSVCHEGVHCISDLQLALNCNY